VSYRVVFANQALKDLEKIQRSVYSQTAKRLIEVIQQNPFQTPPPYEKLVGDLNGKYSRRINEQHRLVYEIFKTEKTVRILSCGLITSKRGRN